MIDASEAAQFITQNPDLRVLEAFVIDVNGVPRGKWIPYARAGEILRAGMAMPRSIYALDVWGRDVDEAGLATGTGDPDGMCWPVSGSLSRVTWLERLDIQKSLLPVLTDDKGLFNTDLGGSSPEWTLGWQLGWKLGNWDASYGFNYSSKTLRSPPLVNAQRDNAGSIIDFPHVKAYVNHDAQVGYFAGSHTRLFAGVRNLTDEYPDKVRGSLNGPSGRQGYAGRTFYVGFNILFDALFN